MLDDTDRGYLRLAAELSQEFADRQLYDQLRLPAGRRSISEDPGDEAMRAEAVAVLRDWAAGN